MKIPVFNEDSCIAGSILGSPYLWKLPKPCSSPKPHYHNSFPSYREVPGKEMVLGLVDFRFGVYSVE